MLEPDAQIFQYLEDEMFIMQISDNDSDSTSMVLLTPGNGIINMHEKRAQEAGALLAIIK
ncbi:MAG: hypothetical protein QM743_03110 [Chitinophagaceae bacterium]